jgi:serine/threonine protein kinase
MPSERVQRQVDRLLEQAEAGLEKQDWNAVRGAALAVLGVDSENADAKAFLAMAEKALGNPPGHRESAADSPAGFSPPTAQATSPSVPSSFSAGRYVVQRFLGEGGKKRVYLAHDTVLDRDVVFALIKTEGIDEASRQRVTREAQAMGRLGDHPNIMPIFDLGQEKDPASGASQPYMVLPLMAGGDVGDVIEKSPEHRVPLGRVLAISRDV